MDITGAIILAGGQGSRMGRPKQMLPIAGKAVLVRSIAAFCAVPSVNKIAVVTTEENFKEVSSLFPGLIHALPGESRILSLQNGIKALGEADLIAVHDGARPLVNPEHIKACLAAAKEYRAAVLCVPVKDTIKQVKDGFIEQTLERSVLWAAQTPQCYDGATLRLALEKYGFLKDATDESQLVEKLGVKVRVVPSGYENIKITTPEDLIIAEALLCKHK
ncbi:MAG: 2-C-methyl-D-erythritol 4-phosphate cytidylyltransferase [Elusimicrobia bacterium]|nr:2-C-methyl-D-erythritol 4-phosphate cytidylyltransferase [Elusimicrobiota bacterium]